MAGSMPWDECARYPDLARNVQPRKAHRAVVGTHVNAAGFPVTITT